MARMTRTVARWLADLADPIGDGGLDDSFENDENEGRAVFNNGNRIREALKDFVNENL